MTDGAPDDPLMPIGMFSRASLVSVKALRSYHELGLLVPDSVDATTGYRSYRVSQLTDAVIIKRLRDLDVPLRSIHEVIAARDPAVTRQVIERHEQDMQRRLASVEQIIDALHESIERPELHTPVHVREEPPTHALTISGSVTNADYAPFLGDAFDRLTQAIEAAGAIRLSSGSALYPATVEIDDERVEAYVAIEAPVAIPPEVTELGVVLTIVPAATCAVTTHVGGYDTIGDTYRRLGAWVARHERAADQPVREHYIVSIDPETFRLLPPEQLRTEICWPIHPTQPESTAP